MSQNNYNFNEIKKPSKILHIKIIADCSLVDDIYQYNFVSQGKITIPSMDDSEEMANTDVRIS